MRIWGFHPILLIGLTAILGGLACQPEAIKRAETATGLMQALNEQLAVTQRKSVDMIQSLPSPQRDRIMASEEFGKSAASEGLLNDEKKNRSKHLQELAQKHQGDALILEYTNWLLQNELEIQNNINHGNRLSAKMQDLKAKLSDPIVLEQLNDMEVLNTAQSIYMHSSALIIKDFIEKIRALRK